MIQPRTQTVAYWGSDFTLTESDIEQIYNHFIEEERPQTVEQIARGIMAYHVAEEANNVRRLLSGRTVYQPEASYKVDDELVFPVLDFAHGTVQDIRSGYNPQDGHFQVIKVEINGAAREFAAELKSDHRLNVEDGSGFEALANVDLDQLFALYGDVVQEKVGEALESHDEFVRLQDVWFVKQLMAEVNIGHLHLTEAILEIHNGGPLTTEELAPQLDMDSGVDQEVLLFSLNYHLLMDDRFDEVAPKGEVAWFLRRMEPEGVLQTPPRIVYRSIPYDRALLSPQLHLLERELDDEWSDLEAPPGVHPVVFTLLFPHRHAGTIPLSARIRPLFPASNSPRQRIILIDDETEEEIIGWVVQEDRYIYGLADWYEKHSIPVGGFVHLKPGPEPGVVSLGYDRRRDKKEWIRLATAVDNRIQFELKRRAVGCGFDDLMIVGTDTIAAIDALWRRAESHQRSVASLLAEIFPQLAGLNPQSTVHAKTLYSALNMMRRVPPGPMFAELVRHPAFQPVGDHYWKFVQNRWQDGN
ncbi:MAG: hypothetical protein HF973_06840 [Chloroflexi bacterium]|nr:hypothetical protein [Chloroflexota bacterium]